MEKAMESEKGIDIEKLKVFWVTEAEEALCVANHLVEKEDFSYPLFWSFGIGKDVEKYLCE